MEGSADGAQRPDALWLGTVGCGCRQTMSLIKSKPLFRSAAFYRHTKHAFCGAYITQAYGRPARGQHAVQVEFDDRCI